MDPQEALLFDRRRRFARWQARASLRGLLLSLSVIGVVLSGALPMTVGASWALLALAGALGISRALRGVWAARMLRSLDGAAPPQLYGRHRRALSPPVTAPESANRRAVKAMSAAPDEPLVSRAREHGLGLVDRLDELRGLLEDPALAAPLRRPVAEELARVESELEALLGALGGLARADRDRRQDLLARLTARLELDEGAPAGLYAGA